MTKWGFVRLSSPFGIIRSGWVWIYNMQIEYWIPKYFDRLGYLVFRVFAWALYIKMGFWKLLKQTYFKQLQFVYRRLFPGYSSSSRTTSLYLIYNHHPFISY